MKHCNTCATTKDISEFDKNKQKTDGRSDKCKLCAKQYRKDNAEKIAVRKKKYRQEHSEEIAVYGKGWHQENVERVSTNNKKYREENAEKEAVRCKKYRHENPDKVNARNAKRRAAKKKRVPKWLNKARKAEIVVLYTQARELTKLTGIQFHVDHIVPLQGKTVSGLHIPDNLQVLTEHENCSKSNKH